MKIVSRVFVAGVLSIFISTAQAVVLNCKVEKVENIVEKEKLAKWALDKMELKEFEFNTADPNWRTNGTTYIHSAQIPAISPPAPIDDIWINRETAEYKENMINFYLWGGKDPGDHGLCALVPIDL